MLSDSDKERERYAGSISALKNSIKDGNAIMKGGELSAKGNLREKNRRMMNHLLRKGREEENRQLWELVCAGRTHARGLKFLEEVNLRDSKATAKRYPRLTLRFPRLRKQDARYFKLGVSIG